MLSYKEYLEQIAALTKQAAVPGGATSYPASLKTSAQRALFDNLGKNENLALRVDAAVLKSAQDGWRANTAKTKLVRNAIRHTLSPEVPLDRGLGVQSGNNATNPPLDLEKETERILDLVKHQSGY